MLFSPNRCNIPSCALHLVWRTPQLRMHEMGCTQSSTRFPKKNTLVRQVLAAGSSQRYLRAHGANRSQRSGEHKQDSPKRASHSHVRLMTSTARRAVLAPGSHSSEESLKRTGIAPCRFPKRADVEKPTTRHFKDDKRSLL